MQPVSGQRLESAAIAAAGIGALWWLETSLVTIVVLALAPDLSMLGYLGSSRLGAFTYNLAHIYAAPLGLVGLALLADWELGLIAAIIWATHIAADRALGYGLKYADSFQHTHLDNEGADRPL
ncbi:MAG: DUF4260 family protein [Halobacteriaceae archaeon]